METTLKEVNAVLGVTGSFVCLSDGSLAAQVMPARFDAARLALAARVSGQTFQALEVSGQRVAEADLRYGQERLILKNLHGGVLVILCARNINIPLLNLTANVAAKKLSTALKLAKAPATPVPVASAAMPAPEPIPAPTPVPAPTVQAPVRESAPAPLLVELEQEIHRLLDAAQNAHITLRVINPLGMWLCCQRARALVAQPEKRHMDFAALAAQGSAVARCFEQAGYQPNQRFNAFYGNRRLNFYDDKRDLEVDVYLDAFEMYHRLDVKPFLAGEGIALPETPLLLIRLQRVEMDNSTLSDICALLLEHDLSIGFEEDKIDASQIVHLCGDDWGWYKTVLMNLERVKAFAISTLSSSEQALVMERVQRLERGIQESPRSLRWQTRSRLSDTARWYETPLVATRTVRPDMAIG